MEDDYYIGDLMSLLGKGQVGAAELGAVPLAIDCADEE